VGLHLFTGNAPLDHIDRLGFTKCKVDTFKLKVNPWDITNLSVLWTMRMDVRFEVVLSECVDKKDCIIDQDMEGEVWTTSPTTGLKVYDTNEPSWVEDVAPDANFSDWWNGSGWATTGMEGEWSKGLFGLGNHWKGTWRDNPGFYLHLPWGANIEKLFPVYLGGSGGSGPFWFRTNIKDKETGITVKTLKWGMRIKYSTRSSGNHYFYL